MVEFKSFSGGVSVRELAITLSAFANTEGGSIYIGVTDGGDRKGVKITPALLDQVQNAAREGCVPPVTIRLDQRPASAGRNILRIRTPKSEQLHSVASGHCYIRVGSQDKRILGDELLRLAETKSQVSFEEYMLDAGIEAIDQTALDEYYQARRAVTSIGTRLQPEQLLNKLGLSKKQHNRYRIRAGAFILFGKESEELLLQREFTFVRYETEGGMYVYREDVRLPAVKMIERLIELIRPHNHRTTGVQSLRRTTQVNYPEEALREVLLNAFAHRDYRLQGLRNECRLYPRHLEIRSAGGLPSFVSVEELGKKHYSRNPKIMHALLILGLVEELGQGIALMKAALSKNGNPPPEFQVTTDQVTVVFRIPSHRVTESETNSVLDKFFEKHGTATRRQIEGALGIGATTAKKVIANLIDQGYLQKIGAARSTRYRKKRQ